MLHHVSWLIFLPFRGMVGVWYKRLVLPINHAKWELGCLRVYRSPGTCIRSPVDFTLPSDKKDLTLCTRGRREERSRSFLYANCILSWTHHFIPETFTTGLRYPSCIRIAQVRPVTAEKTKSRQVSKMADLGAQFGILFGFVGAFIVVSAVYSVLWFAKNRRAERGEEERKAELIERGFGPV